MFDIITPDDPGDSTHRVRLTVRAIPHAEVYVAGNFNQWSATVTPLTEDDSSGVYSCLLTLPPGDYEYKFHINHIWFVDPDNPDFTRNDFGTLNSVFRISQ